MTITNTVCAHCDRPVGDCESCGLCRPCRDAGHWPCAACVPGYPATPAALRDRVAEFLGIPAEADSLRLASTAEVCRLYDELSTANRPPGFQEIPGWPQP